MRLETTTRTPSAQAKPNLTDLRRAEAEAWAALKAAKMANTYTSAAYGEASAKWQAARGRVLAALNEAVGSK